MKNEHALRDELRRWDPARDDREPDPETVRWLRSRVLATAAEAEARSGRTRALTLGLAGAAAAVVLGLMLALWLSRPVFQPQVEPTHAVEVVDPRTFEAGTPLALPADHRPPLWRASVVATTDLPPSDEGAKRPASTEERSRAPRRRFEMTGRGGTRLIWSIEPHSTGDLGVTD